MSRAIALAPWPPISSGLPFPIGASPCPVTIVCQRHAASQLVALEAVVELNFRIIAAFRSLPDVLLEAGNNQEKILAVMQVAGPLCCAIGEEMLGRLYRAIPAIWALRS